MPGKQPTEILLNLDAILPQLEAVYKDVHAHPELSMQETRTAEIAASHHKAESVEFFRTFPDNHLINHPYKVGIAQGDWTCTVADFTGR